MLVFFPGVGSAESLLDAIQMAYKTNPILQSQQAKLRSTGEGVVQARAGYGPQVSFNGQAAYEASQVNLPAGPFLPATTANYRSATGTASLSAVQPLYTSGSVHAQVEAAKANVGAGRQVLRQTEAQLLLNVITVYEDVRRDRQTLTILKSEIADIDNEYRETKARGDLGDLTRTDVAQAQARLISARSQLVLAMGQLDVSTAAYVNVVGQNPGELDPEPDLPGMPASVDDAFGVADHENPQLLADIETEHAAAAKVKQAKAAFGPTISIQANVGAAPYETFTQGSYILGATVAAVVTQPIFTSGLNSSKVHEAVDDDNSAQLDIETTRRSVVQQVARAWDQLVATQSAADLQQRQVELQTTAAEGYRIESKAGMRTTIDLLNAELELATAQLGLLQSRHDEYVVRATLLAAMGRLEMRYFTPETPPFHPAAEVKHGDRHAAASEAPVDVIDAILYPTEPRRPGIHRGAPPSSAPSQATVAEASSDQQ